MNKMSTLKAVITPLIVFAIFSMASISAADAPMKIGIVKFKSVVEKSKAGKQEQETFDAMKKQMESVLSEKEKKLGQIAEKLNDEDYLDTIAPEKEREIKNEFRTLSQEFGQVQNQYFQSLQQANMKILQKISELITKASSKIAEKQKYDMIVNEETSFYAAPKLDVSDLVIKEMDIIWEQEMKEGNTAENTGKK